MKFSQLGLVQKKCEKKREAHESSGYCVIPKWVFHSLKTETEKTKKIAFLSQNHNMGTPPAEELLRKIEELEAGHANLKQEMSKLILSGNEQQHHHHHHHHNHNQQRSHSVSPQRSGPQRRRAGASGLDSGAGGVWKKAGSTSFRHSSPLQRESRSREPTNVDVNVSGGGGGPSAVNFTDRQYLNILQSMGQSVHIFDLNGRIIYWSVVLVLFWLIKFTNACSFIGLLVIWVKLCFCRF